MPRRKKRWYKPKIDGQSIQSALALFFILLGLLVILTLVAALSGVENTLQQFVVFIFGFSSVLLPINFILFGLSLTKFTHKIAEPRISWGLFLLTFSLAVLLGVFSDTAGGWIGSSVDQFLSEVITKVGVFMVGVTSLIISTIIIANKPVHELYPHIQIFGEKIQQTTANLRSKSDDETTVEVENNNTDHEYAIPVETKNATTEEDESIKIVDENESTPTQTNSDQEPELDSEGQPLELPYTPPPLSLLHDSEKVTTDQGSVERSANTIERTLENFGIQAKIAEVSVGPAVTQFAIDLAEGTKTSKITNLQNELALALASPTGSVRIEAPIPGKRLIGIEVPNATLAIVSLKHLLQSEEMRSHDSKLAVAIGEDVSGRPVIADVKKWPHILIAGQTGAGKSALLHSIIVSILYRATPTEVSFIMVDPKRVELTNYGSIPHLQVPIIVDPDKTVNAFKWAVGEMEKRYRLFQQVGARSLDDFNEKTDTEPLPYIVIIVDELADLMSYAANEMETQITRIAQKARAIGILMILATQRPSVNVITGLIKANVPARIALNVTSGTDSRVIIDSVGAEKLLGKGDMLYLPSDAGKPRRVQGAYLPDEEINAVTGYLSQFSSPFQVRAESHSTVDSIDQPMSTQPTEDNIMDDMPDDDKFNEAVEVILNHDKASASLLQRRLKVGYARAARLLDELEEKGLVGERDGSNPREVNRDAALAYFEKFNGPSDNLELPGSEI